ncbi:hypothetical protein M1O18_06670, partial [Dehalococcoidia bacterium]|nr:hypothetical protein [Dehalococcoidia bacterium]
AFSVLLPERAKLNAPSTTAHIKNSEIREALNLVLWIRKHDKNKKERERITGSIATFLTQVWNVADFHKDPNSFSPEKHEEESAALRCALKEFDERACNALATDIATRRRLEYLTGGLSTLPAAFSNRDIAALIRTLGEFGMMGFDPLAAIPVIFWMVIKAKLVNPESREIVEEVAHKIRELQGTIDLPRKEETQTPFMVLKYGCNRSLASR